ncbi:Monothiol glutaredoxin-S2 [Forsythia ovata]|uniref:Monothiol glutaredoxin-S2 n=1 Tax=Forsythia ovata TaxID=205694 RepID=A0ABD1PJE2_9LAMI
MERVNRMVAEKPVVIFSKSSCCMSYSIKSLFNEFGVNPAVYELDEIPRGGEIEQALLRLGCNPAVPAVFIGGEFIGGDNEIMSLHLRRSLKPMLKRAGALWFDDKVWHQQMTNEPSFIFNDSLELSYVVVEPSQPS